ncbi:PorT family protein [Pontibacter sp. JH31]|uniref:PorT family protein n=1 Tax=Pontibacter aquaedesilientis TaxID=2766980 RepID=A0ABR7XKR8_9BACT|nr:PorT family protein [Pontibacter aquaedesilientis]MBD1398884.1 PorT family protein [Pontibacter aquaedesilientis]
MKTLYKLIPLCFLALASLQAAAQSGYKPGYVITSQGDTLRGEVTYRSSTLATNTVSFKKDAQSGPVTYTSNDIAGYGFPNDKNFQTKVLDNADTLAAEYVFMEELVRGNISLYLYNGTFFAEKLSGTGKLHKLYITQEDYINTYGAPAKRDINHHVQVLNTMTQDCYEVFTKVERIKLAQRNLVGLIKEYNNCTSSGEQTVFKESKKWLAVKPGFVAALSHTSLNFSAKDETYLHLEHAEFNTNTYPSFGLAFLVNSPRINESMSLLVEGRYFKNNFQAEPSYTWFDTYYDNEIEFDLAAVKLTTALRYDFAGQTIQPFVNIGGFLNLFQHRDYKHRQYVRRTSTSNPEERIKDNPDFVNSYQQGFMAGAGTYFNIKNRKLSLEARYELGLDLHSHNVINRINKGLDSDTRTVSVLFGLYF